MSTNHRRRNYATNHAFGTSALAAPRPVLKASASKAPAQAASFPWPGNVVELYPESLGPDSTGPSSLGPGSLGQRRVCCGSVSGSAGARPTSRRSARLMCSEAGMATAEYAIATLAAVGFAGLLVFILRSDEVRGFLLNLIRTALALP
ncbi:hypothetical protein QF031_000487 [Pseudarthrobacter defluvii]|uniref:DUF4244 domain-containing protein n=1 Tax=Pseudarthrobacter defluvii TaxID=410837 RepID=UPI00277D4582|nr:DUF4244 domain-containing protein [Pseudarthrobacter defluvii]MDQ0767738.1 hypothetical protein [Pseudarthrobacter defluvii]